MALHCSEFDENYHFQNYLQQRNVFILERYKYTRFIMDRQTVVISFLILNLQTFLLLKIKILILYLTYSKIRSVLSNFYICCTNIPIHSDLCMQSKPSCLIIYNRYRILITVCVHGKTAMPVRLQLIIYFSFQ